jgi:hypothetical protein
MKAEVSSGIEELKRQFCGASFTIREDGAGGAFIVIEPVMLGPQYQPSETWIGFQIPAQYPYADIYPVFVRADLVRTNGAEFVVPITRGHNFQGRPAIQISRRNGAAQGGLQKVTAKILKVLDFLEKLP